MTAVGAAAILRGIAVAALVVAWAALAHLGSAGRMPPDLAAAVALAPLFAAVVILLWRAGSLLWPAAGAVAAAALMAWLWPALRENVALLYFIQHLGTHLALGTLFGRSLTGGHEALVTRFARRAHNGMLSPARTRYTRQVTIAWTLYFAAMATLSTALFLLAPPAAWSVFANLLTLPLLVLMFTAEYLVRIRVLPPEDRSDIADTIRAYRATMRQQRGETPADRP
jgi:uncharacterized membrane protein